MQREHTLLQCTVGLCPECLRRLDSKIIARGGKAFIWRVCPDHGEQCDLLEEDLDWFVERDQFAKPATRGTVQTHTTGQCPYDCGLCPNHEQHTCIGLIELTGACDLQCPVCYASSGKGPFLSLEKYEQMLDFAIESEGGKLEILQLSGGEPTLHPQLVQCIELARAKPVKYILLNTHGLSFVRNPDLVRSLAAYKDRFEVYLQFDGLTNEPYKTLRGAPLLEDKLEALRILSAEGIPTTLVMAVESGVNDDQLAAVVVRGLGTPYVRGVSFQPVARFGRRPPERSHRLERLTISGIVKRLQSQMKGMVSKDHLMPLPCDPDRVAIGYFSKKSDGSFFPMVSRSEVLANMGQIGNTLRFSPEDFISSLSGLGYCCGLAYKLGKFFPPSFFNTGTAEDKARIISETTFRITITSFLDAYNFDLRSCQRECVHVITPELRRIPFSAYNMIHRERLAAV